MSSGLLHANAESFLFGSILTVDRSDAIAILVLTAAAVLLTFLLRYDMIYVAFDEVAAKFAGVRIRAVSFLFSVIAAASVAASIKILGALVISSMVAIPVASALQFRKGIRPSFPSRFLWFQRSAGSSPPMRSMSRQGAPQP
jgi:zinc transport system permease protein